MSFSMAGSRDLSFWNNRYVFHLFYPPQVFLRLRSFPSYTLMQMRAFGAQQAAELAQLDLQRALEQHLVEENMVGIHVCIFPLSFCER